MRLGGAFELFHLAQDTEDLCQTVMDILCAHIRGTTGEAEYRETHPSKPSEEVQSLLILLFVQEYKTFKDCHINLQGSWLNGANLTRSCLQGAKLNRAHLQGIHFEDSALSFAERIRDQIGRESESDIAIFQGGLSRADLESLVEGLLNEYLKSLLRETLRTHIGREESYQLPHDSGAMTGAYTAEEAEQWIAEYEEAMLEVPEEGDI